MPFGLEVVDQRLPGGGLALGALHEVAGGGNGAIDGTASALFAAGHRGSDAGPGPLVRHPQGSVRPFPGPGRALAADRVIYVEATRREVGPRLFRGRATSRRIGRCGWRGCAPLHDRLAAPAAVRRRDLGTMGIAVRRWRRQAEAADFGQPTAAATRWRVTALPSSPLPAAGVGRPRWFVELIRCKAGECADFELEACDEAGRLALPADLADRSLAASPWQRRAAG